MPKGKTVRYLVSLLFGFLCGALFILAVGFAKEDQREIVEIMKPGTFGDVRIVKCKLASWKGGESLLISNGDYIFMSIGIDGSGKLTKCEIWDAIVDGYHRKLVEGWFENDKLSDLWLSTNNSPGSLHVKASDKPGVWHRARYVRSSKTTKKPIGEAYEDIDFDGQFDGKIVFNENEKITSQFIFIDGKWLEVGSYNVDDLEAFSLFVNGKYQKMHPDDDKLLKKLQALPKSSKKRVYYDFEYGKGWKKRER